VDVRDVTSDRARELKLKNDQGVEITMVDQDSPAGKASLKEHDVVVSFNGQSLQSAEQLRRLIRETKPGQSVALGIVREGQSTTLNATLGDRAKLFGSTGHAIEIPPVPAIIVHVPDIEIPSFVVTQSSRRNGITVENLTSQLGEYFGVKNGEGILVRSVDKGSKAEAAGLKAGDVIIRVDNDRVSDTREWSRTLRNHDGATVKLGILRDRREQTLSLSLPERTDGSNWFVTPDVEQLRMQWQDFGPQFAKQQAELQDRIAREWSSHQREIQQSMREAQREFERSLREAQTEREHALRDAQREREKALRDAQRERERALREKEKEKDKDYEEQ
jgi:membrane-associated protease RseP (regulator of RpoE activity)